jgi:GNAT superfamily N-acetyltransferase
MPQQHITVTDFASAHIHELVELIHEQELRLSRENGSIAGPRSIEQIRATLGSTLGTQRNSEAWVALDESGLVRGFARGATWELDETSILLSFLTRRNGVAPLLTLPNPADEDAREVVDALFAKLDTFWRAAGTTGDLVRWPSGDTWLVESLAQRRFALDSICAWRPLQPAFIARRALAGGQRIRLARPEDEKELVALFDEELRFHEQYTAFVHASPNVLQAFQRKLARAWRQEGARLGEPFVLVVEQEGRVIGMAENSLIEVTADEEPGYTPVGHYCCIDNMSVRRDVRGQGLGHALLQGIAEIIRPLQHALNGYVLWYNPDNPTAARFWTRQGFQALWITYQRLN